MTLHMLLKEERKEGRKEGREEGRAEGRKEGREEGKLSTLYSLISAGLLSISDAAKQANLSEDAFLAGMEKQTF